MIGLFAAAPPAGDTGVVTVPVVQVADVAADAPSISALELVLLFGGALLLYALIRAVRWGFPLLPMSTSRRATWRRAGPLAEVGVWMVYLASAIAWTLQGYPVTRLVALGVLAALVVAALWFVIRDYLSGVVVRTEHHVQPGDRIQVGEVHGTLKRLGARVCEIELAHGDVVVMPYRLIREAAITRRRTKLAAARHHFTLTIPEGVTPTMAREAIRQAALLSHWIPPSDEPQIETRDQRTLTVTVHALTDARAGDVEATVRAALTALSS